MSKPRMMNHALLASTGAAVAAEPVAIDRTPPIVGAIRWDAWYGSNGPVKHAEISLGPPKYHFRLPWFARVVGEGKVSINGDSDRKSTRLNSSHG